MSLRTVTTVGTGTATAVPDAVSVVLGIEVEGSTPADALRACGAAQEAVIAALGVPASAGGLSVQPGWDHERQRAGRPQAISTVTARLPDLGSAGEVVTAALEAGGDAARLQRLQPVVTDPSPAREQARQQAFSEARRSAEHYAGLAGARLGALVHLSEGAARGLPELPGRASGDVVMAASFAVAEGPQDVVASLMTTWELAAD